MASVPVLLRLVLFGPVFSVRTFCVPVSPLSPGPEEPEADGEGAGPEEDADGEAESGEEEGEAARLLGRGLEERGLLMVLSRMKCDAARMEVSWIRVRRERFLWSWPSSGMR